MNVNEFKRRRDHRVVVQEDMIENDVIHLYTKFWPNRTSSLAAIAIFLFSFYFYIYLIWI